MVDHANRADRDGVEEAFTATNLALGAANSRPAFHGALPADATNPSD
jgi:hypothetical protein